MWQCITITGMCGLRKCRFPGLGRMNSWCRFSQVPSVAVILWSGTVSSVHLWFSAMKLPAGLPRQVKVLLGFMKETGLLQPTMCHAFPAIIVGVGMKQFVTPCLEKHILIRGDFASMSGCQPSMWIAVPGFFPMK